MKKKGIIAALVLTMAVGMGVTAYAATSDNTNLGQCFGLRLGRLSTLEERIKAVDTAVSKGTLTEEQGKTVKERVTTNMQNCPGIPGQGRGMGRGCLQTQGN